MQTTVRLLAAAAAALILSGCGEEQPVVLSSDTVTQALEQTTHDDPGIRKRAVETLGRAWPQGTRAVPVLSEALDDEDEGVREAAALALETLAGRGWEAVHEFLRDEDDPQRKKLLEVIGMLRELGFKVTPGKAVEYMAVEPRGGVVFMGLGMGRQTHTRPRSRANRGFLGFLARCADPAYQDALGIEDPKWPGTAAAVAATAGMVALVPSEERPAPESLLRLTEDGEDDLAALAKVALFLWEGMSVEPDELPEYREPELGFEALLGEIERHQDPSESVHPSARALDVPHRLSELVPSLAAPQRARVVALLVAGWDSEFSRRGRVLLVEVLGDLGPVAGDAVPLIRKDLEESEATWQRYVTRGEGKAAAGDLVGLYLELGPRFDRVLALRLAAADALGGIGPAAAASAPLLRRLVKESEPALRYLAARSLRRIGAPSKEGPGPGK